MPTTGLSGSSLPPESQGGAESPPRAVCRNGAPGPEPIPRPENVDGIDVTRDETVSPIDEVWLAEAFTLRPDPASRSVRVMFYTRQLCSGAPRRRATSFDVATTEHADRQ